MQLTGSETQVLNQKPMFTTVVLINILQLFILTFFYFSCSLQKSEVRQIKQHNFDLKSQVTP